MSGRKHIPFELDDCISTTPLFNTRSIIFYILFLGSIIAFLFWLSGSSTPQKPLGASQVAALRQTLQCIESHDATITKKELVLNGLEARAHGTEAEIKKYYQILSDLQRLKKERSEYAMHYNDTARNLFPRDNTLPGQLRRFGLPTGIR